MAAHCSLGRPLILPLTHGRRVLQLAKEKRKKKLKLSDAKHSINYLPKIPWKIFRSFLIERAQFTGSLSKCESFGLFFRA